MEGFHWDFILSLCSNKDHYVIGLIADILYIYMFYVKIVIFIRIHLNNTYHTDFMMEHITYNAKAH